eukprot:NODE_1423_length_1096_cov_1.371113.p2 type:complete len:126 gc:universal NODE_1423_length_1096_cov_1.371113:428-51(-)
MSDLQQPSQFPEFANEKLILFNGVKFDSPMVQEIESFHRTIALICYLRYRHEKTETFINKGYSHFNTLFLLNWLKSITESCLTEVMDQEINEADLLLNDSDMESVDELVMLDAMDNAFKNFALQQ